MSNSDIQSILDIINDECYVDDECNLQCDTPSSLISRLEVAILENNLPKDDSPSGSK